MIGCKDIANIFYYYKPQFLISNLVICIVILILLIFGISSYTGEDIPSNHELDWAYGTYTLEGSSSKISLGLSSVMFTQTNPNGEVKTTEQTLSDCLFAVCEACQLAGWLTKDFILGGICCISIVILLTILRTIKNFDNKHLKRATVVFTLTTWVLVVVGFGYWNEHCFQQFDNSTFIVYGIIHTGGFILTVTAWVLTTIVLLFHVLIPSNSYKSMDEEVLHILRIHDENAKNHALSSSAS